MVIIVFVAIVGAFVGTLLGTPLILSGMGFANLSGLMALFAVAWLYVIRDGVGPGSDFDELGSEEDAAPVFCLLGAAFLGCLIGLQRPALGIVWSVIFTVLEVAVVSLVWLKFRQMLKEEARRPVETPQLSAD
jgi:hypothetical protein